MSQRVFPCCLGAWLALCGLSGGCQRLPPSTPREAVNAPDWTAISACLPADVKLEEAFCAEREGCAPSERTTVKQKLIDLGANARGGKLYDRTGREIYFLRMPRSGPKPTREQEQQAREHLEDLRRRYTVVTMYALEGGV